jgi:hypothetical protein
VSEPSRGQEHPSGGGAFAFRTPSGVTPKPGALPNAPYADVSEAIFNVWRPARWANWMFRVDHYNATTNNFTFGHGGFQGAVRGWLSLPRPLDGPLIACSLLTH